MTDSPAYRSWFTVIETPGDDAPWPYGRWQLASAPTDATDPELAELRRRVVDPVVSSVLTADECESVVVFAGSDHDIRVTVVARGEGSFHYLHMDRRCAIEEEDIPVKAAQFASELEDFVAESRFAWGTQRIARYEIPPAQARSRGGRGPAIDAPTDGARE